MRRRTRRPGGPVARRSSPARRRGRPAGSTPRPRHPLTITVDDVEAILADSPPGQPIAADVPRRPASAVLVALADGEQGAEVLLTRRSLAPAQPQGRDQLPGRPHRPRRDAGRGRAARGRTRRSASTRRSVELVRPSSTTSAPSSAGATSSRRRAPAARSTRSARPARRSSGCSGCRWPSSSDPTRTARSAGAAARPTGCCTSSSSTTRPCGGRRRSCSSTCSTASAAAIVDVRAGRDLQPTSGRRPGAGAAARRRRRGATRWAVAPIEKRSATRPSSTVRVNSTSPVALAALDQRVGRRRRRRTQAHAQQVERVRGDDLEAVVGGDRARPGAGSARRGGGSSPGSPRRRRGAASSTA